MPKPSQPSAAYNGPVRLDRLVKACLGKAVARQGFGSAEILTAWPDIVGPELAGRTRPERIRWPRRAKDGQGAAATLVVRAEGGDALELQHMASEVLARLNGYLGWAAVGKLVVRQAPMTADDHDGSARPTLGPTAEGEAAEFDGIDDAGLRKAFGRFAQARAEQDNSP